MISSEFVERLEKLEKKVCKCIVVIKDTSADFPAKGNTSALYIARDDKSLWLWTGSAYEQINV